MPNPKTDQLIKPASSVIRAKKAEVNGSTQQIAQTFPSDLGAHMFVMNFVKYNFVGEAIQNQLLTSSIAFPVPGSLVDSQGVSYNTADLGVVGGSLLRGGREVAESYQSAGGGPNSQTDLTAFVKDITSKAGTALKELDAKSAGYAGIRLAAEQLAGVAGVDNPGSLADIATGHVFNPNIALIFQSVPLKSFSFNWRLAPRTKDESATLSDIIRKLKHFSLPSYSGLSKDGSGHVFLEYPYVVDCFFTGSELDSLFFFKRAAISNITVNYTPEGSPSFFAETGAPTMVDLNISMTEMEIHTSEDYVHNEEAPSG